MSDHVPFSSLALVNPPVNSPLPHPTSEVSFIPMQDVSDGGRWTNRQSKQLRLVGSGYTSFQEGDVLFAKITPCMENGKGTHAVGLINGVGFGSTEFHVLRAKQGVCDRYIYHLCNSRDLRLAAEMQMTGSAGQKRVPTDFFSRYEVTQLDVDEQRTIATILDSIDNAIHHTEQMIEKLQKIKAGLLHDLLTYGLDDNGELRDPIRHPEQFKDSPIGRIPKEWEVEPLGKRITLISGQHIDAKDCSDNPSHTPYLTGPADFPEGYISVSKYTSTPKVICQPSDILITVKGSGTGKTVVADSSYCISRQLMAVRADNCDSRFIALVLESFTKSLRADATGLIPGIAREDLLSRNTRFPTTLEQQRVAEFLYRFDHQIALELIDLHKVKLMKQGLMRDLLTGSVQVPKNML